MTGYGFAGLALLGVTGLVGSYFLGGTVPFWDRFWMNWNFWFLFILTIGLGSLFLVALEYLFAAHWSVPLRRVPERLASLTLFVAPLAIVGLFSLPQLYPWRMVKKVSRTGNRCIHEVYERQTRAYLSPLTNH